MSCGGGISVRSRLCSQPLAGGVPCQGDSSANRTCNDTPCPGESHEPHSTDCCNFG